MKPNSQTIIISHAEAQTIQSYLDGTAGLQGSDRVISKTAVFPNGMEMDVKCCGSDTEASWAEAVLFDHGCEVYCTEPTKEFLGLWSIEYKGAKYEVTIAVES